MRKLLAATALAAAVALPAIPASASEPGPPAGIGSCGPMHYGFVIWVINPKTGEPMNVFEYCQPIGPPPAPAP